MTRYTSTFHFWNNKLVLPQTVYFRYTNEINEDFLKNKNPFLILNLDNSKVEEPPYRLSKSNFGKSFNTPKILLNHNGKNTYILPYYSNQLDVFNSNDGNTKSYQLQTKLISEFTNNFFLHEERINQSLEENMSEYLSEPQNLGILIDPYKNLLNRMSWPGTGVPEGVSSMKFVGTPSHFILSVYDENLT